VEHKEDTYLSKFGDNVRKHRLLQDISQEQLAFETGLTRESINRIENGRINISLTNVQKIAQALDLQPKDLLDF
jgi:transcriptional regulator with XRE-family HTH domain